jgi:acetoin utilization deacetylase AcuC-like enzyme
LYEEILFAFHPDAVVVQCGSDSLALDPLGGFNLSLNGLGQCVSKILTSNLPTLFLGGGGYNRANAAR